MIATFPWSGVRRLPGVSLCTTLIALVLAAWPAATLWGQYDRVAIAAGEYWRLLSGHWTHISAEHLFWDVLMFLVLSVPCEYDSRRRYVICLFSAVVLISCTLWYAMPQLLWYRGLSGLDSALFALLLTTLTREDIQAKRWYWVIGYITLGLAFTAKIGYEWMTGQALFVGGLSGQIVPVPLAHVAGATVGLGIGLICNSRRQSCDQLAEVRIEA